MVHAICETLALRVCFYITWLILGQNCIQLLDATLSDLFFFKNLFFQKQSKYAMSLPDAAFNF